MTRLKYLEYSKPTNRKVALMDSSPIPYKILQLLYILDAQGMPRIMFNRNLAAVWNIELYQLIAALDWLHQEELAEKGGHSFYITIKGREAYEDACKDPTLHQLEYHKWIQEALTGMTTAGNRSTIDRAALPGHKAPPRRQQQEAGSLGLLAKELDMTVDQLHHGITSKALKLCGACGKFKKVEKFHRNQATPDGRHGWCKHCRKVNQNQ